MTDAAYPPICCIADCSSRAVARGWCNSHYALWRRHGDVNHKARVYKWTGPCTVEGCSRPAKARGWCLMHYARWTKHGDPAYTPKRPCWWCGETFEVLKNQNPKRYCSPQCQWKYTYAANKAKWNEKSRRYREAHKDEANARQRANLQANPILRARRNAMTRRWRLANLDKAKDYEARYLAAHRAANPYYGRDKSRERKRKQLKARQESVA